MPRLIVFGCSLAYGHGLPDCFIPPKFPGHEPSKMGWPSIIAKCFNRDCINTSSAGASNKKIWNTILNFEYQPADIVFISWSFADRYSIITEDEVVDVGTWQKKDSDYYKSMYDEYDSNIMSSLFISHANMFLKSKKINVFNLVPSTTEIPLMTLYGQETEHIPVYINELRQLYPYALDHRHPGIECQEVYSKEILDYLNVKNDLPTHKPLSSIEQYTQRMKFSWYVTWDKLLPSRKFF